MNKIKRERYKKELNCTDEQLDRLLKVVRDTEIANPGYRINFDVFVQYLSNEVNLVMNGGF